MRRVLLPFRLVDLDDVRQGDSRWHVAVRSRLLRRRLFARPRASGRLGGRLHPHAKVVFKLLNAARVSHGRDESQFIAWLAVRRKNDAESRRAVLKVWADVVSHRLWLTIALDRER